MKKVYLYGKLGERFGKELDLNVQTPQEAFLALSCNFDGFLDHILESENAGSRYIILNKSPSKIKTQVDLAAHIVSEGTFNVKSNTREIHIIPEIKGSGLITTIITAFKAAAAYVSVGKIVAAIAVAFVVGAIMKALFKPPKKSDPTTTKSYLLKGAQNRQAQGVAVPLGYGRLKIGSTNVSQNKATKRDINETSPQSLESFSEIEFLDLLSEGPIEGFVNQNGARLNDSDISEGIFLNNVPIANTPISKNEEPTLNYILNEGGELPDFQKGEEGSSKVLSSYSSFVIDYDLVLYGAGPYTENGNEPRDKINYFRPTTRGAKENGAKIAAHFVANKNISKIVAEFNTALSVQDDKGQTFPNDVRFAILIEKDHQEKNVLDPSSGCTVSFPGSSSGFEKIQNGDGSDGHIKLKGLATSFYAFDVQIEFAAAKIQSKGVTFKFIKLSDEFDPSVKGAQGGIGRSRTLKLVSVCELIEEPFLYPHSAMCKIKFDSKNFSNLPQRAYHVKLKKVLIPSNYDPFSRKCNGHWDGLFKGQGDSDSSIHSISDQDKYWTDNPAWVFYDLLHNCRYGVGRYGLEEQDIDKWQLYKISKYCDELVNTDYPVETSSSLPRTFSTLNNESFALGASRGNFTISIDSSQLGSSYGKDLFETEFGSGSSFNGKRVAFFIATKTKDISNLTDKSEEISILKESSARQVGEIIIEERVIISSSPSSEGGGTVTLSGPSFKSLSSTFQDNALAGFSASITVGACATQINHPIVEPRFSCNVYMTDRGEALSILNNMASVFRGILSYGSGKIFTLQDSLKNPVQSFNNSNISKEGFSYAGSSKGQKISTSLVRFNNKDDSFRPDIVYEEDSDAMQRTGFKEKETLGFGITSSSQARRLAKWILLTSQLEVETVSFSTSQEASYLFPGAIFEVFDEMRIGKSKAGRILGIEFYRSIYETAEVNGVREIISKTEAYSPYLLLDKNMIDEPFTSRVELTVCVGISNSTKENLELRAPFERSELDQDAEINSTISPQVLKFDATIEYNPDIKKKGSSGQNAIATDLFLKIFFNLSLSDNTISVPDHNFSDGDRVRFLSEGRLPLGLSFDRKGGSAYYIIESTKHTFKLSSSASGAEINIMNQGFDPLGHPGGLHYLCPEDPQETRASINQIMLGSAWSAKGLMNSKGDQEINQIIFQKLSAVDFNPEFKNWHNSSWLGLVYVENNWGYLHALESWVFLGQLEYTTEANGFWFYMKEQTSENGWIWTNEANKDQFWFFMSIHKANGTQSGWVTPLYKDGSLVEFFIYDKKITSINSKNIGDDFIMNGVKLTIVQKNNRGFYVGKKDSTKIADAYHQIPSSEPSDLAGKSLNERRQDLIDSGYLKEAIIENIEVITQAESIQRENSVKITLNESTSLSIKDSEEVFIEAVTSSNSFADNINVIYVYDSVNKIWATTVNPWVLVRINDFQFELKNSSSLYSLYAQGTISDFGVINFLPPPDDKVERQLEGQSFRTMSVKQGKDNTYEVVGLEYNPSKFNAVDKKTIVKRPVLPIPPQADMSIPEAPDSLILTDLTR